MRHRLISAFSLLTLLSFYSPLSLAGDGEGPPEGGRPPCRGDHCRVPTREECFNLVCDYEFEHDVVINDGNGGGGNHRARRCTVAAKFNKNVTIDGGEVQDDSTDSNNPQMQVSCDGTSIFGPSGTHRFTDLLGTRIQGQMGPNPALLLPRGALHTGAEHDTSGSHYSQSMLELRGEDGPSRAYGKCFIWTGAP